MSLLEIVVAMAILGMVMVSLLAFLPKWENSINDSNTAANISDRARDVFTRICDEIRESGMDSPDWELPYASNSITFNKCTGCDVADRQWGSAVTYSFNPENGTITRTVDGESVVICANVTNLTFTPEGNNVRITFETAIQGRTGRTIETSLVSLVLPRN